MTESYPKMYIAVLDEVPDFMVPTLVAHSVLNAHVSFNGDLAYNDWWTNSYRKVTVRVNRAEFDKIKQLSNNYLVHAGHENKTLGGEESCLIVCPVMSDSVPNVLKFAKMWKPSKL